MHKSFRRLLALLLLLTLPLQGLSAVLMPFHCLTDSEHAGMSDNTPRHQNLTQKQGANGHHQAAPQLADNQGSSSNNDAGHMCCNHVFTGVPSVAVLTAPEMPFVAVTEVANALSPFVPDRLLRPPRT